MGAIDSQTVNMPVITKDDLKRYKTFLQLTNTHLQLYETGGNVQTSRGPKFMEVISKLFPQTNGFAELKFCYISGSGTDVWKNGWKDIL